MKTQREIAEELRKYLLTKERTQKDLAEKIGISTAHLSNYLRGQERISRKVADKIVELWPEIRLAFLLSGEGAITSGQPIQHLHHINNSGQILNASVMNEDAALRAEVAQLRAQLDREREEKERLLGIIETITGK